MGKRIIFVMIVVATMLGLSCDVAALVLQPMTPSPIRVVITVPVMLPTSVSVAASPTTVAPTVRAVSATATPVPLATSVPAPATPVVTARRIIYSVCDRQCDNVDSAHIWVVNADGSRATKLIDRGLSPSYAPDGARFVYQSSQEGLYIANADGSGAARLGRDVYTMSPDWSHDGKLIAYTNQSSCPGVPSAPPGQPRFRITPARRVTLSLPSLKLLEPFFQTCNPEIVVIAPDGTGRRVITVGEHPTWSPDDTQIAYDNCVGTKCGIYRIIASGGTPVAVTDDTGSVPHWSRDGKQILYQVDVNSIKQMFVINVDGSGKKQLTSGEALHVDATWSLDGGSIYFRSPMLGSWDILIMNADGTNTRKIIGDVPPVDWANEKLSLAK